MNKIILSVLTFIAVFAAWGVRTAGAAECAIPRGEAVVKRAEGVLTFVVPSQDCKTVRVYQTFGVRNLKPTDAQCRKLGGEFSPFAGLGPCHDFLFFRDRAQAVAYSKTRTPEKPGLLTAYLDEKGALITELSGWAAPGSTARYQVVPGAKKLQGEYRFAKWPNQPVRVPVNASHSVLADPTRMFLLSKALSGIQGPAGYFRTMEPLKKVYELAAEGRVELAQADAAPSPDYFDQEIIIED